ncbi:MAG: non-ribosomal peptide synthetase [Pseudomonadota bacterium]|nr:non-ribosomal peptide synthetase [Pseudomonadota bacterium]
MIDKFGQERRFALQTSPKRANRPSCPGCGNAFSQFEKGDVERSIPERFLEQVRKHSQRLAVKTHSDEFTYGAVNKAANRLAQVILASRGTVEEPVITLIEPGTMAVASMLAILNVGKIWVSLDPSHPPARNAYIVSDCQATLVLTDNKNSALATELVGGACPIINIDETEMHFSGTGINLEIRPSALACIIYTSGSSGQPKGVVHSHRSLLHLTMRHTNALQICAHDRLALLASFSHIAGVVDILRALLNGAALLPFDFRGRGIFDLRDWLIQKGITIYHPTPSLFRRFAEILNGEQQFPKLRVIHLGGDTILKRDVELYRTYFASNCILYCGFGSTEAGIIVHDFIDKETYFTDEIVSGGYAVPEMEVFLIGQEGEAQEARTPTGEIAVRSRYVALEYWRRPELTCERFTVDPLGSDDRTYRTGDMGCLGPDGRLRYVGREDFQVKIRGNRVDLREIEIATLKLEGIKEAVVIAAEDDDSGSRLIMYYSWDKGSGPSRTVVRQSLSEILPDYMIPSQFVRLDRLPLTPSGKVDRRALPQPDEGRPDLESQYVAPRTPVEEVLAAIWAEVLRVERVGAHDNFFEMGGNSLRATQVTSRMRDRLHIEVPLRSLFEAPTVTQLAAQILHDPAGRAKLERAAQLVLELERLSEAELELMIQVTSSSKEDRL